MPLALALARARLGALRTATPALLAFLGSSPPDARARLARQHL
jgi:hypothetical protein